VTWLYLVTVLQISGALPLYAFMAYLRTTVLSLFYLKELYTVWVVAIPVDISDKICLCVLPSYFNLNNVAIHNIFKSYVS